MTAATASEIVDTRPSAAPPARAVAPGGRLARLDVLRAVAIFLVMGRHLWEPPAGATGPIVAFIGLWQKVGWLGVDLFFVLSGFLVSGLLFREHRQYGTVLPGRFLVRRGFKIYPAFYFFIGLVFLLGDFLPRHPSWLDLFRQVVFIQNYAPRIPGAWDHTWSLAVEEHFYILLTLAAAWRLRARDGVPRPPITMREATTAFLAVAGAILAIRCATTYALLGEPWNKRQLLFPTHLRIDSLLFGVYLAYLSNYQPAIWRRLSEARLPLALLGLALVAPSAFVDIRHPYNSTIGYTVYYLGFGALLIAALGGTGRTSAAPRSRFHPEAILAFIGASSYSIYLWHMPVNYWGREVVRWATGELPRYSVYIVMYMVSSIVVGIVMARIVEGPFLRLRDRWFPSRTAALG